MTVWADELHPVLLADDVVPQPVSHARTARLIAQVIGLALDPATVDIVERLGLRWSDGTTSSPDFLVLPAGSVSWETTSYAPGTDGPVPLVAVEIVVSSPASPGRLLRRGIPTYVVYIDPPFVHRFDPDDGSMMRITDDHVCADLGGIRLITSAERLSVVDDLGEVWADPDAHLRGLRQGRQAALAELAARDAELAARDAEVAELRRQLAERNS